MFRRLVLRFYVITILSVAVAAGLAFTKLRGHGTHPAPAVAVAAPDDQVADFRDAPRVKPEDALAEDALDPTLALLLRRSAKDDSDRASPFFTALADLAREHGLTLNDYDPTNDADEGYAVRRRSSIVVVLRGNSHFIPGDDTQTLILFGRNGDLLDRLSCAVNNRLTRWFVNHRAGFCTEAPEPPEKDGAQLILRYKPDGDELSGNWSHIIQHGDKDRCFGWGSGNISPADWAKKGLCRVAIREGKFVVLFPDMGNR